jgi:hypothetical protein
MQTTGRRAQANPQWTHSPSHGLNARLALVLVLAMQLLLVGCGGATGRVVYPAEIPVRAYPQVFLVHGSDPEIIEFATRLQRHLLRPNRDARTPQVILMHRSQAEQLMAEQRFPVASVVVDLRFGIRQLDHVTVQQGSRAGVVTFSDIELTLTLTVHESNTGRILQVFVHTAAERGRRRERNLEVVLRRFAQVVFPRFDPRAQRVRLHVPEVDHPLVAPALELLVDERWSEARGGLEAALQDPGVLALPPEVLARVHYNLAIARRFDPATMGDLPAHYAAAQEAAAAAAALDPTNSRYAQMQLELIQDAERAAVVRQHETAAAVNYGEATIQGGAASPSEPSSEPPLGAAPGTASAGAGDAAPGETTETTDTTDSSPSSDGPAGEPTPLPYGF